MSTAETTPKRAAIYCRVSTAKQAEHGLSLDEQERQCRAYIDGKGWKLVDLYSERGESGRKANRPELDRLLANLDALDVVVIPSFDRLGRSTRHLSELYDDFDKAGMELVSLRENIDTTTTSGRLLRTILSGMAEFESDTTGERVASVSAARAANGKTPGGRFGIYGYDRIDKVLVPNEFEAGIVREMFEQAAAGRSAKQIAQDLNARRIKTKDGSATWWPSTISRTLRHPAYAGKVRLKGKVYDGEHKPIVSADLWERVAALRAEHVSAARKGRTTRKGRHLFVRGLLRCGVCGHAMGTRSYIKTGTDDERREQYICLGRDAHGRDSCPQTPIPREPIDSAVLRYFNDVALDLEASKRQFTESIERQREQAAVLRQEAERDERQMAEALDRIERDYIEQKISGETFEQSRQKWADEREAAAAEAERLRQREHELADGSLLDDVESRTLEHLAALQQAVAGEVADAKSVEAVRAILWKLFDRFVVGRFVESAALGNNAEIFEAIESDPDILKAGEYVVIPFERPEMVEGLGAEWRPILRREAMPFVAHTG